MPGDGRAPALLRAPLMTTGPVDPVKDATMLHAVCGTPIDSHVDEGGVVWRCSLCDVTVGCRLNGGILDLGIVRDE